MREPSGVQIRCDECDWNILNSFSFDFQDFKCRCEPYKDPYWGCVYCEWVDKNLATYNKNSGRQVYVHGYCVMKKLRQSPHDKDAIHIAYKLNLVYVPPPLKIVPTPKENLTLSYLVE